MKKYILILSAALTLMFGFAACTELETPMNEQNETKVTTIMATIESDMISRVALTDDETNRVLKVAWETGDDFKINVNGNDYTFTYTENDEFECTDPNFPETFTAAGTVTATYPATAPADYKEQQGTLEGAADLITMTAALDVEARQSTSNMELQFKHNTAVVKLNLSNEDFAGKSVTSVGIKAGGTQVVTATEALTGDADGSVTAYFVIPSASFAMTSTTIHATCNGNSYSASLSDKTLEAGKLYNVNKQMTTVSTDEIPYLTFSAEGKQTFRIQPSFSICDALNETLEWSLGNSNEWKKFGFSKENHINVITIEFGGELGDLRLRGKSAMGTSTLDEYTLISFDQAADASTVACTGDIRTLVDWENYTTAETGNARFRGLFNNDKKLISAPALPATKLATSCYARMFISCSSLTEAPELPATTLSDHCYSSMFQNCTSLATAPKLPATELAEYCYEGMFINCTSLITGPKLPATTLAKSCYYEMFRRCTSLVTAPELPATTLAPNCYEYMFAECSKLVNVPERLPVTKLADYCYRGMFCVCTSLATGPKLPAATLAKYCYSQMFQACTSLNNITMLATDISAEGALNNWLYNVANTGILTKAAEMKSLPYGASGIPWDWTAINQ